MAFRDSSADSVVFPELREWCANCHLHLVDVDLRWGVTEEDAQRGRALEICLREIEDCRPFFVGLLGERYGWIPPRYDIPDEEKFDALRNIEPGHSITAMEIYQGVLNNSQMRAHAWRSQHGDPWQFTDPSARQQALDTERQQERSQLRFILTGVSTRHREPTPEQAIERETANPLYLKLVRLFGEYDRLPEFIAQLPTDGTRFLRRPDCRKPSLDFCRLVRRDHYCGVHAAHDRLSVSPLRNQSFRLTYRGAE